MDASTILSIVSIVISLAFAITGVLLARKSDTTLTIIQTQLEAQLNKFMSLFQDEQKMIQDERKTHDERTAKFMESMWELIKLLISSKGDMPKEKAENLDKQLNEILRIQRQYDSNSVLSTRSKVEDKKTHA